MQKSVIDLSVTPVKTALRIMIAEASMGSMKELAERIGMKETTFRSAVNNGNIRLKDFLKVAQELGYSVVVTKE
ncbi:helix-turn-helix domain-containing protein [Brevibacillus formosus]|uniref:helix-turn-helix domain-containing protein n=1 Tax=Brevibacillus formosus TaxID=54913 RepID=UPI0018CFD269|nr:helix-turn-helix domain-containing protein [Brevibacillus formosus]MBG9941765.1 hypothetical protein [Brevibacillus formosus]